MSLTPSSMLPLGAIAPDFNLPDSVSGNQISLQEIKSDIATVVIFICNHCPYVRHVQNKLVEIANQYQKKNIQFVAISSNDSKNYPQDGPDKMRLVAEEKHYPFPYLFDETQEVARNYHAACTPDFFIFDKNLKCVYRGQFDDSRPGNNIVVSGKDLCDALEAILAGNTVNPNQRPSIGCNIKWKK